MNLMNLARHQPEYTLPDREPVSEDDALWYSKEVRRLVKPCVRFEPNRRPTFEQLLFLQLERSMPTTKGQDDSEKDTNHNPDSDPMNWGESPERRRGG